MVQNGDVANQTLFAAVLAVVGLLAQLGASGLLGDFDGLTFVQAGDDDGSSAVFINLYSVDGRGLGNIAGPGVGEGTAVDGQLVGSAVAAGVAVEGSIAGSEGRTLVNTQGVVEVVSIGHSDHGIAGDVCLCAVGLAAIDLAVDQDLRASNDRGIGQQIVGDQTAAHIEGGVIIITVGISITADQNTCGGRTGAGAGIAGNLAAGHGEGTALNTDSALNTGGTALDGAVATENEFAVLLHNQGSAAGAVGNGGIHNGSIGLPNQHCVTAVTLTAGEGRAADIDGGTAVAVDSAAVACGFTVGEVTVCNIVGNLVTVHSTADLAAAILSGTIGEVAVGQVNGGAGTIGLDRAAAVVGLAVFEHSVLDVGSGTGANADRACVLGDQVLEGTAFDVGSDLSTELQCAGIVGTAIDIVAVNDHIVHTEHAGVTVVVSPEACDTALNTGRTNQSTASLTAGEGNGSAAGQTEHTGALGAGQSVAAEADGDGLVCLALSGVIALSGIHTGHSSIIGQAVVTAADQLSDITGPFGPLNISAGIVGRCVSSVGFCGSFGDIFFSCIDAGCVPGHQSDDQDKRKCQGQQPLHSFVHLLIFLLNIFRSLPYPLLRAQDSSYQHWAISRRRGRCPHRLT